MPKKNVLTGSILNQSAKNIHSKKEIKVNVEGKEYSLMVYDKFPITIMNEMIKDLKIKVDEYRELELEMDAAGLFLTYVIKYFTDLDVPANIHKQIEFMNVMIDTEVIPQILPHFDEESLNKLAEMLNRESEEMAESLRLLEEQQKLIEEIQAQQEKDGTPGWDADDESQFEVENNSGD